MVYSDLRNDLHRLLEVATPILFHRVPVDHLVDQLQTNRAKASVAYAREREAEMGRGRPYYLSTARSLLSRYFSNMSDDFAICTLDGTKLSHTYRAGGVHYGGGPDEMEDRLFSDKPFIENWSSYIKNIRLLFTRTTSKETAAYISKVVDLAKRLGIEVRIFSSEREMLSYSSRDYTTSLTPEQQSVVDGVTTVKRTVDVAAEVKYLDALGTALSYYLQGVPDAIPRFVWDVLESNAHYDSLPPSRYATAVTQMIELLSRSGQQDAVHAFYKKISRWISKSPSSFSDALTSFKREASYYKMGA